MPLPAPRTTLRLLASVAVMVLCTGFTATLLPLAAGDATAAARIASAHFAGALAGVPAAGPVIARLGASRAALLFALTIALGTAGLAMTGGALPWMALRFAAGGAASGYFVLVESRLNAFADAATRGRLMAAYLVATYAAQAAGTLVAGTVGPSGTAWLFAMLPLPLLAVLPVLGVPAQPAHSAVRTPWTRLLARAPAAFAGSACAGLLLGGFNGLGPLYAAAMGGGAFASGPFMAAALLGGLATLGPVGHGADLGHRERWLIGALTATAGATVVLALTPAGNLPALCVGGLVLGASAFTLYPLASGCANDAARADERLAANSLLLLLNAAGACAGPVLAGWAMTHLGAGRFLLPAAMACIVASAAVIGTRQTPERRASRTS